MSINNDGASDAGSPKTGNRNMAMIAAVVVIAAVVLGGYYWYHTSVHNNVTSTGTNTIASSTVNTTTIQTSNANTTAKPSSGPINVTGANGIFNNSSKQKPPTPPSSVGG